MKKLWDLLVLLLAVNFLVVAGAALWLFQSGHLDRERVKTIKLTLFPPPSVETPATQPAVVDAPPPASQHLQELLARHAIGHSASEQVEFIQQNFDASMAQLDRREREVADRERQVGMAAAKLAADRKALETERGQLKAQEQEADRLAGDKGFQDTLSLYNSMPSRQVKSLFMTMDDALAAQYLDAMQPRTAAKIMKEFKTTDETDRLKRVLEKMRRPPGGAPATQETKEQ